MKLFYLYSCFFGTLVSCASHKNITATTVVEKSGVIELIFTPMAGDKPLYLDSVYTSPAGEQYRLKTVKFFVSDIAFSGSNTPEIPAVSDQSVHGVYLVDFAEPNTDAGYGKQSHKTTFTAKTGNYSDIRFNLGVPRKLNHADPTMAPYPLDLGKSDLFWEWNSGYIFLLIEGESNTAEDSILHFALGGDSRIMPCSFGDIFNATPLIQVKEQTITSIYFSFDIHKMFLNGDGSSYSFKKPEASIVHGGYYADMLRINAIQAINFISTESREQK